MKDDRLLEMRVFRAVVETAGFTAAAARLDVSQPFVSQTIANLEKRLSCKLLHRSTRSQRLTQEGERFLLACIRVMDAVDQAEYQMRDVEPTGELHVSAPLAFGLDQVVPRLPEFMAQHPRVTVHLSLSDVLVNLIDSNVDVAIRMGRLQDSTLVRRKICDLHRIVVAAPSYIRQHGIPVTPEGLESGRHNCLTWKGMHKHLNSWPFIINKKLEHVVVRGSFHSDNGSSLYQMCLRGVGIMRLAEHLALPAIARGDLIPVLADYTVRDDTAIYAVYLKEGQASSRVSCFVNFFLDAFRAVP